MSLLDQAIRDMQAAQNGAEFAGRFIEQMLPHLDDNVRALLEATRDGRSFGEILGVTAGEKEALLDLGCRLTQLGRYDDAAVVLLRLVQLDPLEERALYALGVSCQLRGDPAPATRLYLQFLALDATNPAGYLRLGECLLAAGDHPQAHDAFLTAQAMAEGRPECSREMQEAQARLALPQFAATAMAETTAAVAPKREGPNP